MSLISVISYIEIFIGFYRGDKIICVNNSMNTIKKLWYWIKDYKRRRALKKRIEELRKRDPFIY